MFSKACEYALRAVIFIYIKGVNGARLSIPEIAKEIDAPLAYTGKILQTLTREGVIASVKGPNGGFFVDPQAKAVTLADVVKAMYGNDDVLHTCVLGLKECSDKFPCPIHAQVKGYRDHVRKVMENTTIRSLVNDLSKGRTFLKNVSQRKSFRK